MLPTTRLLQRADLDLVEAMASMDDLLGSLNALRTSQGFVEILDNTTAAAQLLGVTLVKPRTAGRSVYRATASRGSVDSIEDYYRINIFFPALDAVLQDMELRFGPKQRQAASFARAVPAFMQFDDFDGDWAKLQNAIRSYNSLITDPTVVIKAEYELWRHKWQQQPATDRPRTALAALDHCAMFPNLSIILQLLATFPVTTAEAERGFSKMKRTLTAIRSSMEEERFEALLLQVHREDTPSVDAVLDHFAATSAWRLNFILSIGYCQSQLVSVRLMCRPVILYKNKISSLC